MPKQQTPKSKEWLNTFGRRMGRRLTPIGQALYDEHMPRLRVPDELDVWLLEHKENWLEIGFGGGEHLLKQAKAHPDIGMIGCEPFVNGVAKLVRGVVDESVCNIRIYDDDARLLLHDMPDAALSKVFLLFPDPWPKPRHFKRRFIQPETIAMLARLICPLGQLHIVSDHPSYIHWTLMHMQECDAFSWQAEKCTDFTEPPQDWLPTRYQEKQARGAAETVYLTFLREK